MKSKWVFVPVVLLIALFCAMIWPVFGETFLDQAFARAPESRVQVAKTRAMPKLQNLAALRKVGIGAPVFIRIFKQERELELWLKQDSRFVLLKTYPICTFSGELGPKVRQGDGQAPEGFYRVRRSQMNPASSYHLSFNLGYPNAYDRAHRRTGDYLMVHGNCVSIGCYAMGDAAIEEIYTAMEAAFSKGQVEIDVHAFPFRLSAEKIRANQDSEWIGFWQQLAHGYAAFERTRQVPLVQVKDRQYVVEAQ